MKLNKSLLPLALVAALSHGLLLAGCGGSSSPTGPSGGSEVRLKFTGAAFARAAVGTARSADVPGATVLVDGVPVGVTDAEGEISLQLAPGVHSIAVTSGGITSSAFQVTVGEGEALKLEVELKADGTLDVAQDTDHDGDVDDDDDDDDDDGVDDDDDDDDDDDGKVPPGTKV